MTQAKNSSVILTDLKKLQEDISRSRSRYRDLVDEYYTLEEPFLRDRPSNDVELENDIDKFQEIIEHCLMAGNAYLLEKWLLKPLQDGDLSILARQNNIEEYVAAIESLISESTYETRKFYLTQIKVKLLDIREEGVIHKI